MDNAKIMIVEDEGIVATDIAWQLTDLGYDVVATVCSGEEAVDKADKLHPDLVLMDIVLTGKMDGIEAADIIRSRWNIPIVFLTAYADQKRLDRAKLIYPFGYILKPFKKKDIMVATEMALYISKADEERRKVEDALQESEERHRTILKTAMDGFWLIDIDGHLLEVNDAYCRMSGYSEPELLTMHIHDLDALEAVNNTAARIQKVMAQGEDRFETKQRRKDGGIIDVEVSTQYRPTEGGRFVAFLRDITEHKKAEEELLKSKIQYEKLYQHARECYAIIDDTTGCFTQPNLAILKTLGYSKEEFEGLRLMDIVEEFDREGVGLFDKTSLEKKDAYKNYYTEYDCWIKSKAGERRHINIIESQHPFIKGTLLSGVDFTEQEKMKLHLMQSEKLSSLGQLAAGLAHELRNPLAVISSCAQFCLDNMSLAHPVNENLQVIYRSSQRANELINNLLEFARPSHMEWGLVDINELVTRMWHMSELEATPFQISFVEQLEEGLPKIMGDADKLGQVFLNLFLNAIQAASNKGKIVVQTHFLASKNMINVMVIDDGHGIPKDYHHRIFDPFFTTKDCGTGLGLSICHSIVQQHNGSITIDSVNGGRTIVSVRLPVTHNRKGGEDVF